MWAPQKFKNTKWYFLPKKLKCYTHDLKTNGTIMEGGLHTILGEV